MAGLQAPLSTLRLASRDALRITRGQYGLLFLFRGLAPLLVADLAAHQITRMAYPITCRAGCGIGGSGIFGGDLTGFSSLLIFGQLPAMVNEEQLETTATILQADLDAFYASVEQLLDPSLRGSPIAVGGINAAKAYQKE